MEASLGAGFCCFRTGRLLLEVPAELRDVERRADPARAALARFGFGAVLRAEVRGLETRRVFAITSARLACGGATVTNRAQTGQGRMMLAVPIQQSVYVVDSQTVTVSNAFYCISFRNGTAFCFLTYFDKQLLR